MEKNRRVTVGDVRSRGALLPAECPVVVKVIWTNGSVAYRVARDAGPDSHEGVRGLYLEVDLREPKP